MIEPSHSPPTPTGGEASDAEAHARWMASRLEKLRIVAEPASPPPTVSRRRLGTGWWLAGGAGVLVGLVALLFAWLGGSEAASIDAAASVVPAPVVAATPPADKGLLLGGWVRARRNIDVGSAVSGVVSKLHVRSGSQVRRGEIIAELANGHLLAQVEQSRATVALRQAAVDELRNGALPEEVAMAEARVAELAADHARQQGQLDRRRSLHEAGLISRQELEDLEREVEAGEQRLLSAREQLGLVRRGPRDEKKAQAEALLREAQASLRVAEAQLDQTLIRAPISGVVVSQPVEVGELVSAGFGGGAASALVTIADTATLIVEVDVPHGDVEGIRLEDRVQVTSEAVAGRRYPGRVTWISPEANRQKLSVAIEIELEGDTTGLIPGLAASVRFARTANPDPSRSTP
ncbi:MAG TPA: HlyD family efflux transporter periplasmic adaptor subunit [Thermoanaerobaculia bacterium]|nr:HlyD family efflux transporter periplasmic adaptor subunit [Thermoanaerobaculia bacterium]